MVGHFEFIKLQFFRTYPPTPKHAKPHIMFYSNELAVWHGLPDIRPMVDHLNRSKVMHPYRHLPINVCVQYERNPGIDFRDVLREGNADRLTDELTAGHLRRFHNPRGMKTLWSPYFIQKHFIASNVKPATG